MTDFQQSGWDTADSGVPANVSVVIEEIEGPAANVAVTAVRPDGDGRGGRRAELLFERRH